jgi:hypothetical protein
MTPANDTNMLADRFMRAGRVMTGICRGPVLR